MLHSNDNPMLPYGTTMPGWVKTYYHLTKPGIIYGNVLNMSGGFLLAARGSVNLWLFVATLAGVALIIASACVVNNYLDRSIDKKMTRTKQRALVTGQISARHALIFAGVLGASGFAALVLWVNWLVVLLGVIALVDYVVLYGLSKRKSVYGTIVGSVAGALPAAAGYCAVTGRFDLGAVLLFAIVACWQMPHFYAISLFRRREYAHAGLPVLGVVSSARTTKVHILGYVAVFVALASLLTVYGYAGYVYLVGMMLVGLLWLRKAAQGFTVADDGRWARGMFGFSLLVILSFDVLIALTAWLP